MTVTEGGIEIEHLSTSTSSSIHDANHAIDGTLLPENVASMVTTVSLATRISLRCSSLFFDAMFEAAKYGTSLSLGLSRTALVNAISTAKHLHSSLNNNEYINSSESSKEQRLDNNNDESLFVKVLEKYTNLGLYIVNHTFSLAELFAISGLQFTSKTIQSSLKAAEESVRLIDGIFGSNDTSRAIASIITLVHRELAQDPEFGLAKAGKLAILAGLTKALTAFAVLQNVTHKRMMKQIPMTVLWEGVVTDEKEEEEEAKTKSLIQFKRNSNEGNMENTDEALDSQQQQDLIVQELNNLLSNNAAPPLNNAYKISTKTTCLTTKTTTISPLIDSGYNGNNNNNHTKRIVLQTNEEENESFLALVNNMHQNEPKFILSTLSDKRRKRKVERQDNTDFFCQSQQQKQHHRRRFSSSDYDNSNNNARFCISTALLLDSQQQPDSFLSQKAKKYNYSTPDLTTTIRQRHASSISSCLITNKDNNTKRYKQKRSSSISSTCSDHHDGSKTTTTTASLAMTSSTIRNNSNSNLTVIYDDNKRSWNYPQSQIVNNIAHFMKYASAAYGESFMRILGIGDIPTVLPHSRHHHPNHHAFAHHTGNSVEDILLSSYTDRSPLHLHNPSIHALVHYVTVDHAAKAIVLTCRGTLGLSDILTDLSFNYTEFTLPTDPTRLFKAHSGMLDAAQLLAKEKGKVYQKVRQGLLSYPDYSLVLCGHSLGGGVASLLCVLWSQPNKEKWTLVNSNKNNSGSRLHHSSFVTSKQSGLPPGRSIHCYAYGPPGVMSLELSNYCAGLVTSVVHGYDIVSSLSLGLLKDFKNIATSLQAEGDVAEEIISRVIGRIQKRSSTEDEKENTKGADEFNEDDQWFWAMIKTMRADMTSEKMYPPSTVYWIETIPHVKEQHKIILCRCEDVEARFSEIVFTRTMFMDHSPLMYERAIRKLCRGFTKDCLSSPSSSSPYFFCK